MSPQDATVSENKSAPSSEEIAGQLDRLTGSDKLRSSERLCRFLRFVVAKTVSGAGDEIKEYSVATAVYGRPESFDPKTDSIVRVEASRLRTKLRGYYESEGRLDEVIVELPKGAYLPTFTRRPREAEPPPIPAPVGRDESHAAPPLETSRPADRRTRSRVLSGIVAAAVLIGGIAYWRLRSNRADLQAISDLSAVAVLPFVVLNPDMQSAGLSRGLADDIAHILAQSKQLRVAGPSATAGSGTLPLLRKELKVGSVLQGSIRQAQSRIRLNVQLVSTLDGYHLWSAAYEQEFSSQSAFQAELAKSIAGDALANLVKLVGDSDATAGKESEALAFYRNGSILLDWNYDHLLASAGSGGGMPALETIEKAIQYFEKAVSLNPKYARAQAALAHSYVALDNGDAALTSKARASAMRAIQLDDTLASAHAVLGYIKFLHDWDFTGAESEFKRALDLQPRLLGIYRLYGDCASMLDHHQAAWNEMESGAAIFPDSPIVAVARTMVLFHSRRFTQMADEARALQNRHRDYPPAHWLLGLALEQQGSKDAALAEFEKALKLTKGDRRTAIAIAHVRAVKGERAAALQSIDSYRGKPAAGSNAPYAIAMLYTALGDREQAFQWLEEAYRQKDNSLPYMKLDPRFDPIRGDRRFAALLAKMKLE